MKKRFPSNVVRFIDSAPASISGSQRPIAFIHINKTAGTTLMQYLTSHYADANTIAPNFFGRFDEIRIQDHDIQLYRGHFTYAQFSGHRPDAWFIAFLRDPVQRIVSQYKSHHNPANLNGGWARVLKPADREAMEFAQRASFEQYVMSDSPFIVAHLRDLQTRYLSSVAMDHPRFLSSALENLETALLFFGIAERFAESIQLFQWQLGSAQSYSSKDHDRNLSRSYPAELGDRVVARIDQLVQNDLILYRRATEIFQERYDQLPERWSDKRGTAA